MTMEIKEVTLRKAVIHVRQDSVTREQIPLTDDEKFYLEAINGEPTNEPDTKNV